MGIHKHFYNNNSSGKNVSFDEVNTPLLINHYAIQSKDFWCNVKMTRGDVLLMECIEWMICKEKYWIK